eukprot:224407-Karenia_brevis.AAC.1
MTHHGRVGRICFSKGFCQNDQNSNLHVIICGGHSPFSVEDWEDYFTDLSTLINTRPARSKIVVIDTHTLTFHRPNPVSYTHLRAHETLSDL